jgi:hypothetical protein
MGWTYTFLNGIIVTGWNWAVIQAQPVAQVLLSSSASQQSANIHLLPANDGMPGLRGGMVKYKARCRYLLIQIRKNV